MGFWKKNKPQLDKRLDPKSWAMELIKIITRYELQKREYEFDMAGVTPDGLRAFLAPTVYVMLSDRARQPEEDVQLLAMLVTSPALRDTTPKQLGEVVDGVIDTLRQKTGATHEQKMRDLLRHMPSGLNESAYAYAVRISYADQLQTEEEMQALQGLRVWMGVPADQAANIDSTMRLLVSAPRVV